MLHARRLLMAGSTRVSEDEREEGGRGREWREAGRQGGCLHVRCDDYLTGILLNCSA